ncbi:MAG: transcription termination factor NusA [Lachnospiraceae bacterium]|nr:transcription termination factor NusA [Lachnospiraceae bacterium]
MAKAVKKAEAISEREMVEAIELVSKEKNIDKEILFKAIEASLVKACENNYGKTDNFKAEVNRETGSYRVYAQKTVVEEVTNPNTQIDLASARLVNPNYDIDDVVNEDIDIKNFGRIIAQGAKSVIIQAIREAERKAIFDTYNEKTKELVTGIVQKINVNSINVNIGKMDAVLTEKEMVKGEVFKQGDRIKLYVVMVRDSSKGPRVVVSRSHPELVRKLFENEVAEIKDGIVEIKSIAREAGSRTKIAVMSHDPDVDPIGACVGINGSRVNQIVSELRNEKIDIVLWSENPAELIEKALSPAKVVSVLADSDARIARVVVPDYQLSLAIGKEGQNARLAAKLTNFTRIDIMCESDAEKLASEEAEMTEEYDDEETYEEVTDEEATDEEVSENE